jgi:HEAT repeat protein
VRITAAAAAALGLLAAACATPGTSTEPAPAPRRLLYDGRLLEMWAAQILDLKESTSSEAVHALSAFRADALPHVEAALASDRAHVRYHGARVLYNLAHDADPDPRVVALLRSAAGHADVHVRRWAVGAFGEVRPPLPGAAEVLEAALRDPDGKIREKAARHRDALPAGR